MPHSTCGHEVATLVDFDYQIGIFCLNTVATESLFSAECSSLLQHFGIIRDGAVKNRQTQGALQFHAVSVWPLELALGRP